MSKLCFRAARLRFAPVLIAVLGLVACDSGGGGNEGEGGIGSSCTANLQCGSGVCLPIATGGSVCSEGCTDPLGDECPSGWQCRRPDEVDALVCVCEDPSPTEICDDTRDNDCNGQIDDCMMCGATSIPPTSTLHCGACDRRCVAGSTCDDGECVCDAKDAADCVLEPGDSQCESDTDCNDAVDCTLDACSAGVCLNRIEPSLCGAGESCNPLSGCTQGAPCDQDFECFDSDPCTDRERCDFTGFCVYLPLDNDVDGFVAPACGGIDCNDQDGSIAPGAPEQCDGVDNTCDGVIDEPLSASACGVGAVCSMGACGCPNGLFDCGDVFNAECSDLTTDARNCGGCGTSCETGFACVDGRCADIDECESLDCPPSSDCVNLTGTFECRCQAGFGPDAALENCIDFDECAFNADNCSAVSTCSNTHGGFTCSCNDGYSGDGVTCSDVDECSAGNVATCGGHGTCINLAGTYTCSCAQGYAFDMNDRTCELVDECAAGLQQDHGFCDGTCTDLLVSTDHCGECEHDCNADSADGYCDDGQCACNDALETFCEGSGCVNTDSSTQHCGECFEPCPQDAGCVGGQCFCPINTTACDGACVALGTTASCLACGDECASGASCEVAGCTCPAGTPTECGGECVNTTLDERYCGNCDTTCPDGATCTASVCDCPDASPDVCDATCVDLDSNENYCGNCQTSCEVACNEGHCVTATQVVLGNNFGCARFSDAQVACFGFNGSGQLGRSLPIGAPSTDAGLLALTSIAEIAAHALHACALDTTGALRCWGENGSSQLGSGTTDATSPFSVRSGVADFVVGSSHTCVILSSNGTIECVGSDALGQHGDGATVTASATWSMVMGLANVDELVSGNNHLCALNDGVVSCWGSNSDGQIGVGTSGVDITTPTPVTGLSGVDDIDAGGNHTCAVVDGAVYCWGASASYQSGAPSTADQLFATAVAGISDAVSVSAADTHTCVLRTSGNVTCWGSGVNGENGRFSTGSIQTTIAGPFHGLATGAVATCVLTSDNDIECWGDGPGVALSTDSSSPRPIDR
jgi:alpha-tubulin suppressor-like RCC1 family protein